MKYQLHPRDIYFWILNNLDSGIAITGAIAGASLLLLAGGIERSRVRSAFFGGAAVVAVAGKRSKAIYQRTQPVMGIIHEQSTGGIHQWYGQQFSPYFAPDDSFARSTPESIQPGDLGQFGTKNGLIIAPTGTGKSTIAKALAKRLGGNVTVVDPHNKKGDWDGLTVLGGGRNFTAIEAEFVAQLRELSYRYQLRDAGLDVGAMKCTIVDEWPAIASNCESAAEWLKTMGREGRKAKMPIIVLAQDFSVKALGVEGEGDVREAFDLLFLGKAAISRARSLKDPLILEWLKRQPRPGLYNDSPLNIPEISELTLPPIMENQPELKAATEAPTIQASSSNPEQKPAIQETEDGLPDSPEQEDERLKKAIAEYLADDVPQHKILREIWGVTPGGSKKYKQALAHYRRLVSELA